MDNERRQVIDQMGFKVDVPRHPQKIISLVPSLTELLFDLGLGKELIGITKFCVHPSSKVGTKTKVGGTKKFNFEKINRLYPDLIIGNKEENYRDGIERLKARYPVWMSDIKTLEDNREMILALGQINNRTAEAQQLTARMDELTETFDPITNKSVIYLIWRKPYMAVGGDTYINQMLKLCGFENVLQNESRYPELDNSQINALRPDVILLSSEPFPFKSHHVAEFKSICPDIPVLLVDGEMFSWYGSRLLQAIPYFRELKKLLA